MKRRAVMLGLAASLAACATAQAPPRAGSGDLGVVVGRASGTLSVVDTSQRSVLGRIDGLGDLSHASVVYARDGATAFVFGRDGALTKVNNTIGQALLARRMGKPRVIAETGAGQHGVATATICARYGLECVVYMGSEDVKRQSPNVYRMHLLGAKVVPVESGSKTLKDALNEALRDWVTNVENTFYIIGTVAGPAPYPEMVRDFQRVIGDECLTQMPQMIGRQPDAVIACVGGGSNAMGIFFPYIPHDQVRLIGVEAAGLGLDTGKHAASISAGSPGVLHGNRTYLLQDDNGQITETHSVSAGLDYPGVGPEHAWLHDIGRAEYVGITDDEALAAFHRLCRTEGIIPALESSHAVAHAMKLAATMRPDQHLLVNLSGRGDKDIGTVADLSGAEFFCRPSCKGQAVKGGAEHAVSLQRQEGGAR